eukprot:353115-Chlamydomonas_euryale.AAC.5
MCRALSREVQVAGAGCRAWEAGILHRWSGEGGEGGEGGGLVAVPVLGARWSVRPGLCGRSEIARLYPRRRSTTPCFPQLELVRPLSLSLSLPLLWSHGGCAPSALRTRTCAYDAARLARGRRARRERERSLTSSIALKLVPTVRNPTRLGLTCMQTERPLTAQACTYPPLG